MEIVNWFFLSFAILGEVIATSALKSSEGFTKMIPSAIVIIGYGVSFFFLSLTLKYFPIGIAYATWSGVGIALVTLIGLLIYKQSLDVPAIMGIIFIVLGVIIINLFSKTISN